MRRIARPKTFAAVALGIAALPGCASLPEDGFSPIPRAEAPAFDPLVFFAGRTEGRGTLDKGVLGTVPVRVESEGELTAPGVLTLRQIVYEGDKPARERTWRIDRIGQATYRGDLTDAYGPVEGWASGNMLTLRYTMEGNYDVTQRLILSPDGDRATNAMKVELLGATVAVLAEEIVRSE